MIEKENIARNLYHIIPNAWELQQIHDRLLQDIILPIEGEALRRKLSRSYGGYAYIKIRILQKEEKSSFSTCKWSISENEIPMEFRENVEKILSFFITHFRALKGDSLKLDFEIIDGSYSPTDSIGWDYEYATLHAIINAFDKNLYVTDHSKIYRPK